MQRAAGHNMNIGVLMSGGVDSSILVGHLLRQGRVVQPFYVRTDLCWASEEYDAATAFLQEIGCASLRPLKTLELPLADLYESHWSVTGDAVPDDHTEDDAVYLPGRNALLTIKVAIWCQAHGIHEIALATLQQNPFPDATDEFFESFSTSLTIGGNSRIRIIRPFEHLSKKDVLRLGADLPLDLTFSCIEPTSGLHCGQCNKCAERHQAFDALGQHDPTVYASGPFEPLANSGLREAAV